MHESLSSVHGTSLVHLALAFGLSAALGSASHDVLGADVIVPAGDGREGGTR